MDRLLITGANGNLGRVARAGLAHLAGTLRLSDIEAMDAAAAHEEVSVCDLADFDAVRSLVEGCDGIVHLGGMSVESTFETILQANIRGTYNIYEAARQAGTRRIMFASSNHAIGFHTRETRLGADAPFRPDSLYGVSKCFGETLARLYYDKYGIETALVRIGSCFPEPRNPRMLATWLSQRDFINLLERIFSVPRLGCPVIYGASANDEIWWDNSHVGYVGWNPQDNAAVFRGKFSAEELREDAEDPAVRYQGGPFAAAGHFEEN